jgi:hypothetical protein
MNWQNFYRTLKSDYLKLLPIMALAFYLAFIPHHDYAYLVHLDEWLHLASSQQIVRQATTVDLAGPLSGAGPLVTQLVEPGFHLFWAVFHLISGLPWLDIFKYFPSIVFMITVLSVYVLTQRQGFGWEAALFTCLVPTTVGILGPGFLVPVAMALLFIPLFLFVAFNFRTGWSYIVLAILIGCMVSIHAVAALVLIIIAIPFILLNLKSNLKHSLGIILAAAIPFVATLFLFLPWIFNRLPPVMRELLTTKSLSLYVELPRLGEIYGYIPILLCLVGTFQLARTGGKRNYGLILGLLALLLILITFFVFHYGDQIVYYRGLLILMLIVSVVAGAGLMSLKNLRLPERLSSRLKVPLITQNTGNILCLILICLTLTMCIPARQSIPYYHMIDKEDYEAFVWIKENVTDNYTKAVLDPWKATAFACIAEKYIYHSIGVYPTVEDLRAYHFLRDGCKDTAFMEKHGISIVYTQQECHNLELVEVRENVYLLKQDQE